MAVAAAETAADAVRTRRIVAPLALLLALAGATQVSSAQTRTVRSPDVLISEGQALYDAGLYKEAAASFERAMQLGVARPHEAAWNVARSYAKLGNRKQAGRWAEIAELLGSPDEHARPPQISLLLKI